MSSVQSEVLRDILQSLDRWTLDDVQFANGRFMRTITVGMSNMCLRRVQHASIGGLTKHKDGTTNVGSTIHFIDRPLQNISNYDEDAAPLFAQLMHRLRGSHVATLVVGSMDLTPELAALVLETPISVHKLKFVDVNCAELTPTRFQEAILHFSPTVLDVGSRRLGANQLTDGFFRALSKNISRISFGRGEPADGGSFHMTNDAVVNICAQQDARIGVAGDNASDWQPYEELVLYHGTFTKDLFERLVEASTASTRVQTLRIVVSPVPHVEDEDLQGFAQHLSYRKLDEWEDLRVYDFPDETNGMHLQMKLSSGPRDSKDSLVVVRARRPNRFFYEPHE